MPVATKQPTNANQETQAHEEMTPAALERAPTLYQAIVDSLDETQRRELARLTPFARELQLWLWSRPGPTWSHRRLALSLGIPESTVNAWFGRRGTRPEGSAYRRILAATGWPEQHLLALAGYDEPPPYTPDMWDYVLEQVEAWPHFDGLMRRNVTEFLEAARMSYTSRPRRPSSRRKGTGKDTGGKTKDAAKSAR